MLFVECTKYNNNNRTCVQGSKKPEKIKNTRCNITLAFFPHFFREGRGEGSNPFFIFTSSRDTKLCRARRVCSRTKRL